MGDLTYHVRGAYFESCNCEAICPCRMIGGVPGGRSTYGICYGVLSWLISEGSVDEVDVSGLAAVLVSYVLLRFAQYKFFIEAFGVWVFAYYWWTKSREFRITSAEERAAKGRLENADGWVTEAPTAS